MDQSKCTFVRFRSIKIFAAASDPVFFGETNCPFFALAVWLRYFSYSTFLRRGGSISRTLTNSITHIVTRDATDDVRSSSAVTRISHFFCSIFCYLCFCSVGQFLIALEVGKSQNLCLQCFNSNFFNVDFVICSTSAFSNIFDGPIVLLWALDFAAPQASFPVAYCYFIVNFPPHCEFSSILSCLLCILRCLAGVKLKKIRFCWFSRRFCCKSSNLNQMCNCFN